MAVRTVVLLTLLLSACAPVTHPGQDEAAAIVWNTFGATAELPFVDWREDDCGGDRTGAIVDGLCYSGRTLSAAWVVVAWRGSFTASAFAHEHLHAWQASRGIWDDKHESPEWALEAIAQERLGGR